MFTLGQVLFGLLSAVTMSAILMFILSMIRQIRFHRIKAAEIAARGAEIQCEVDAVLKPRKSYRGPFELAPDILEQDVEAVLRESPRVVASRPTLPTPGSILDSLGYDEWGNNGYLLHIDDKVAIECMGVERADPDVVCEYCRWSYHHHPKVQGALWATRVCGPTPLGRLVKL